MTAEEKIQHAIDNAVSMGQVRRLQAQLKELTKDSSDTENK